VVSYKCPICGRSFNSKRKLNEHLDKVHRMAEEPETQTPQKGEYEGKHPMAPSEEEVDRGISDAVEEVVRKVLPGVLEEMLPKALEKVAKSPREKVEEREIEFEGGTTITRKIKVYPDVLKLYEYVLAHGAKMSFDEFINETVLEHFTECLGIEPAIVRHSSRRGAKYGKA